MVLTSVFCCENMKEYKILSNSKFFKMERTFFEIPTNFSWKIYVYIIKS